MKWNAVKEQESGDAEKEWQLFRGTEVRCAEEGYGMGRVWVR